MILSACSSFMPIGPGINEPVLTNTEWEITVRDFYQGTKLGNLQSITLEDGYGFITLEACFRNLAATEQVVTWGDISITVEDGFEMFPVGQGYKQSEAFGWLLPFLMPLGVKGVVDDLWYTPIQSYELISLPSHQNKGCEDSDQFKTFAYLFMVEKEVLEKPFTLRFFDKRLTLEARKPIVIPRSTVRWLKRLGWIFLLLLGILFWLRKRRQKREKMIEAVPHAVPPSEAAGQ